MNLLIYDDENDLITEEISKHQGVLALSIKELYSQGVIEDNYEGLQPQVKWRIKNHEIISNQNVRLLINRIRGDVLPSKNFHVYLSHAINFFPNRTHINVIHGYPQSSLPLPYQWKILRNESDIPVPNWNFNLYSETPKPILVSTHVISTMYGYYHWKEKCDESEILPNQRQLVFSKPMGKPIHIFYCYQEWTSNQSNLDIEKMDKIVSKISAIFGIKIAELLVFINDEQITFGMINPFPGKAVQHLPRFSETLKRGLENV